MSGGQHSSTGILIGLEGVANTNSLYFVYKMPKFVVRGEASTPVVLYASDVYSTKQSATPCFVKQQILH